MWRGRKIAPIKVKVFAPYTKELLRPETQLALNQLGYGFSVLRVETPKEDSGAYWKSLQNLWRLQERFLVVEHDLVPTPSQLDELYCCSEDWCSFPLITRSGEVRVGWGQKFSEAIQAKVPDALNVPINQPWKYPATHWWQFAGYMERNLQNAGFQIHKHEGLMVHLGRGPHPYQPGREYG